MTSNSCILACIANKKSPPFAFFQNCFVKWFLISLTKDPENLRQVFLKAIHFFKRMLYQNYIFHFEIRHFQGLTLSKILKDKRKDKNT